MVLAAPFSALWPANGLSPRGTPQTEGEKFWSILPEEPTRQERFPRGLTDF
jgi:hypothetical protein